MKPDQLSQTAAFIAIKFYGLTLAEPYRSLFDEETVLFYDRLVRDLPSPFGHYHSLLQKKWIRKIFLFSEETLLPGDLMHILMRKYYIQKMMSQLKQEGYKQLLVLGAGFDHLAVRYSSHDMQCIEFDAPRMAQIKQDFTQKYDYENEHLTVSSVYFSEDTLEKNLNKPSGISKEQKTIVIAEGFFDYFTPQQTSGILDEITSFFNNNITLITTVFSLKELPWYRAVIFKSGVWMVGEELKLHCSLPQFSKILNQKGFSVEQCISSKQMQTETLAPLKISLPVLRGLYLVKALYQ